MANCLMSKVVVDVISDNFCLNPPPKKHPSVWGGGQKMKILSLGANSTKFCIHNLGAYRELEMQKLTTQNGREGQKMKILALEPN